MTFYLLSVVINRTLHYFCGSKSPMFYMFFQTNGRTTRWDRRPKYLNTNTNVMFWYRHREPLYEESEQGPHEHIWYKHLTLNYNIEW